MTSSVAFYCGPSDNARLTEFIESCGLRLAPMQLDTEVAHDPADGPYCYISAVEVSELKPYGTPPVRISNAGNPLLGFLRAYYKAPYLVLGHIQWSDDSREMAEITKPWYGKIKRWIAKEWQKKGSFYFGPEALCLLDDGAKKVNFLPNSVTITTVWV